jgi:hypothetical protein
MGFFPQQNWFTTVSLERGLIVTLVKSSGFAFGTGASYLFITRPHSPNLLIGSTIFVLDPAHEFSSLFLISKLKLPIPLGKPIPPSHEIFDSGCHLGAPESFAEFKRIIT